MGSPPMVTRRAGFRTGSGRVETGRPPGTRTHQKFGPLSDGKPLHTFPESGLRRSRGANVTFSGSG